jgi:hypothetical protein
VEALRQHVPQRWMNSSVSSVITDPFPGKRCPGRTFRRVQASGMMPAHEQRSF